MKCQPFSSDAFLDSHADLCETATGTLKHSSLPDLLEADESTSMLGLSLEFDPALVHASHGNVAVKNKKINARKSSIDYLKDNDTVAKAMEAELLSAKW